MLYKNGHGEDGTLLESLSYNWLDGGIDELRLEYGQIHPDMIIRLRELQL